MSDHSDHSDPGLDDVAAKVEEYHRLREITTGGAHYAAPAVRERRVQPKRAGLWCGHPFSAAGKDSNGVDVCAQCMEAP